MENDILKVLITEEQIRRRVQELGVELTKDYEGKDPVIVGVLKGVVVFYADMIRQIKTPCQMDFMWISSYAGTTSTGSMQVKRDISADIRGRHVLILEDIFDTGNSLDFTYRHLLSKEPASLDKIVKKVRTDFSEEIKNEEIMLPFEFIIGSLFPSSYNAVKDVMTQQYIEGYNKGYEEGKNDKT